MLNMNINAHDLSKKKFKDTILEAFVKDELKKIEKKIIIAHQMRNKDCDYEIKRPLNLDFEKVLKEITKELRNKKFKTVVYDDGSIYINWDL